MNSLVIIPDAKVTVEDRLISLLDAMAVGLWPAEDCTACRGRADGRCGQCSQAYADIDRIGGAIGAVQDAKSDAAASAAFWECIRTLAAVPGGGDAR